MDRERLKTLAEVWRREAERLDAEADANPMAPRFASDWRRDARQLRECANELDTAASALLAELERVERERDAANRTLVTHAAQVLRLGQILKPLGYEKGTTFDEIARDCVAAEAENARLRAALEMIAGRRQPPRDWPSPRPRLGGPNDDAR